MNEKPMNGEVKAVKGLEKKIINNIFDYLHTFGSCFTKFNHEDKRVVTIKWHGEINMFTASWIENDNILTGIFSEKDIYNMLNKNELVVI